MGAPEPPAASLQPSDDLREIRRLQPLLHAATIAVNLARLGAPRQREASEALDVKAYAPHVERLQMPALIMATPEQQLLRAHQLKLQHTEQHQ